MSIPVLLSLSTGWSYPGKSDHRHESGHADLLFCAGRGDQKYVDDRQERLDGVWSSGRCRPAGFNPIAGLFLAVQSFAVKYTSVAYLEAIPALTSLAAALAYLRWITLVGRQPKALAFNHNLRIHFWLALSAVALGLTVASKYEFGLVGIAIVVHYAWTTLREGYPLGKAGLYLAGFGLAAGLVFFAGDVYLWPDPLHRLLGSIQFNFHYQQKPKVNSVYPAWQIFYWFSKPVSQQDPSQFPTLAMTFRLAWIYPFPSWPSSACPDSSGKICFSLYGWCFPWFFYWSGQPNGRSTPCWWLLPCACPLQKVSI